MAPFLLCIISLFSLIQASLMAGALEPAKQFHLCLSLKPIISKTLETLLLTSLPLMLYLALFLCWIPGDPRTGQFWLLEVQGA